MSRLLVLIQPLSATTQDTNRPERISPNGLADICFVLLGLKSLPRRSFREPHRGVGPAKPPSQAKTYRTFDAASAEYEPLHEIYPCLIEFKHGVEHTSVSAYLDRDSRCYPKLQNHEAELGSVSRAFEAFD